MDLALTKVYPLQSLSTSSDEAQTASKGDYKAKTAPVRSAQKQNILILRCSVLVCIVMVAGVIGYFAYTAVFWAERNQFEREYSDLVKQLLPATNLGTLKTASAVMTAVNVIEDFYPNASAWPNIAYSGFPNMAILTSGLSGAVGMGFTPIVYPSQVASFEAFAYDHYSQYPAQYPDGTAESSFGKGIHSYNYSSNATDQKYHDRTGALPWASTSATTFLTPYMQISGPGFNIATQNKFLMLNLRGYEEAVTNVQDAIIECVANRVHVNETCAMVSGMKKFSPYFTNNAHLFVMQPFIARDDPHKVLGFVSGTIFFTVIVKERIPVGTSGIDYVVRSGDLRFTYRIIDGVPKYIGDDDLHDRKYDKYERVQALVEGQLAPVFGLHYDHKAADGTFTIAFYPTREYVASFETNLRWVFCFGSVALIMLVSMVFITYDYFMVRENTEQQAVLDTKRQFVRFISHEVRTPLNAVAMAGDLMRETLFDAIRKSRSVGYNVDGTTTAPPYNPALEESLELCEEIIGNTKNAVEVLDDLLNYDKIEVGGLSLDLTFVAMEHILDNVLKPFKGPAKQKEVTVEVRLDQYLRSSVFQNAGLFGGKFSALRVVGDKVRLEQVIRNLISNALKFTTPLGKIVVNLEWIPQTTKNSDPRTPPAQVKSFLKAPSPLSSSRQSKLSNSPKTQSRHSAGDVDVEMGNGNGRVPQIPEDEAFPTVRTASPIKSAMETDEFNRRNIIKSAMTRRPKEAFSSLMWGSLRLSVTDNGAGMSAEQLRAVCSEGVQFNANELQAGQGSGLGLFIAKGIVKQHGGQMTVTSEGLGKGSSFIVELPVYACDVFSPWESRVLYESKADAAMFEKYGAFGAPSAQVSCAIPLVVDTMPGNDLSRSVDTEIGVPPSAQVESLKENGPEVAGSLTRTAGVRRVLVVDDVASNRKLVIRLLQRSGVEVCEQAADGLEAVNTYLAARKAARDKGQDGESAGAVDLAKIEPFDAILMDCEMPVMNGPTATKKLRELGCSVPIVGISGNVLPVDVQLFISHGANAVLPKPLDFGELEKIWKNAAEGAAVPSVSRK